MFQLRLDCDSEYLTLYIHYIQSTYTVDLSMLHIRKNEPRINKPYIIGRKYKMT